MNSKDWQPRKVAIVGAGGVGASFAYALVQAGVADDIALIDLNQDLVRGQVLDLTHGSPFVPHVNIHLGSDDDYPDAHVVVITAGSKQEPGESRLNLLQRNAAIIEQTMDDIAARDSDSVVVVVTNPVDVLTYVALRRSGKPKGRVIGSGTVLDSARLRYLLSRHCGVDIRNVHAYILGEHGDSEVAAWSMTHVAGMLIDKYCPICMKCSNWEQRRGEIAEEVRNSAYHIIDYKGSTCFGIGLALVRIVSSILRNEHSVLTVSTLLEGEYGLDGVCLSVPCLVSGQGVERVVEGKLTEEEIDKLGLSASILRRSISELADT